MIFIEVQAVLDILDFIRATAAAEANGIGVVLVGARGYSRQAEGGTQVDPMDDGLVDTDLGRLKSCLGGVTVGIHLVGDPVRRRLQAIVLRRQC